MHKMHGHDIMEMVHGSTYYNASDALIYYDANDACNGIIKLCLKGNLL